MAARPLTIAMGLALAVVFSAGPACAGGKRFSGLASYYDKDYRGRTTSGQPYDPAKFTAAHRTLPFGTRLRVSRAGFSVIVVVNDRGPTLKTRVLDLSLAAAKALHMIDRGVAKVSAEVE